MSSSEEITADDLISWEEKAFEAVGQAKSDATLASKFYAYLWTAQRDFVALSSQTQGRFCGDIGVISREVTCLFFSESCPQPMSDGSDRYSEAVADLVLAKITQRMEQDKKTAQSYEIKEGDRFWKSIGTFKGIDAGSWQTWLIRSGSQFRLPPPPGYGSREDQAQLRAVKSTLANITDKQKKAIAFWATGPGTKTAPGTWLKVASDAMRDNAMHLETILLLRSVLAMILADTEIAAMDSKYTHWVMRPYMRDKTILTFVPTPNHPSYPSEHAAIAGASPVFHRHHHPIERDRYRDGFQGHRLLGTQHRFKASALRLPARPKLLGSRSRLDFEGLMFPNSRNRSSPSCGVQRPSTMPARSSSGHSVRSSACPPRYSALITRTGPAALT